MPRAPSAFIQLQTTATVPRCNLCNRLLHHVFEKRSNLPSGGAARRRTSAHIRGGLTKRRLKRNLAFLRVSKVYQVNNLGRAHGEHVLSYLGC